MTFRFQMLCLASLLAICTVCASLQAGEKSGPAGAEAVELFSAIEQGQIDVKLIPKDSSLCNVLIENKTQQPLTVKLPEAFAGVPVLAQGGFGGDMGGMGGGMGGGGYGGGGGGGGGQGIGGGMGGMGGMSGMGGMGGGFMSVPAERVGKFKVTTVCLEHGKPEPRPAIPYAIAPIGEFTEKKEVHELCKMLGYGKMPQRVAQAAAWAMNNDMSWQELAAKELRFANGSRRPYFAPMEIQAAIRVAEAAKKTVKDQEEKEYAETSSLSQN